MEEEEEGVPTVWTRSIEEAQSGDRREGRRRSQGARMNGGKRMAAIDGGDGAGTSASTRI